MEQTAVPPFALPSQPLVSVIMPAFNAQAFIRQAVVSVLAQDYPHIELIVVDDGSTDGTLQALAEFAGQVRVPVRIESQANAGPAAARNRGLATARGELIAFLDADDLWLPGKLKAQVNYLQQHPDVAVVFGGFKRWEAQADGEFDVPPLTGGAVPAHEPTTQPSGWIYSDLLLDSVVHIITALVRKPVFDAIGSFDESLSTGEDYDFWLRASRRYRIDQLARTVAWYRIHAASITKMPRAESNEYRVLHAALQQFGATGPDGRTVAEAVLNQRLFGICFGHGYLHFWQGDPRHAHIAFSCALGHAFWHPRVWAYWLLSGLLRMWPPRWRS
jgi:glycosyltransferase involved in cell wall biosynthesis